MVIAAVVYLPGLACGAGDANVAVFQVVFGAILVSGFSLSSIVLTTASGLVDAATSFQEFR